jgi:energy-coupling factor transporter ATP-binding protein EcfA2
VNQTPELVMNAGQQNAINEFVQFLFDPNEKYFVIRGHSGTGKSTLIDTLLKDLPKYYQAARLIDSEFSPMPIQLTATTHKAADNFSQLTGTEVTTVHSFLGLRLHQDYESGHKQLVAMENGKKYGYLIFVDEASYLNPRTLMLVLQQAVNCKIVFIGDPDQLLMPKSSNAPVFAAGFKEVGLEETMRQMVNGVPQANPITELAHEFRHTVTTGKWPEKITVDGHFVKWLPRDKFLEAIEVEFTRPDWTYKDSKILAWTNDVVIQYNNHVRSLIKGDPQMRVGDYVDNNSYILSTGKTPIKTDETVLITEIEPPVELYGVTGNWMTVNKSTRVFHPQERKSKAKVESRLRANGEFQQANEVVNWADFRAVFAQTVFKAQGSTYGKVYIDLDDIGKCNMGNLIARMLYVGISRARYEVILTGDLA